jgi:hypothetical protein
MDQRMGSMDQMQVGRMDQILGKTGNTVGKMGRTAGRTAGKMVVLLG